MSMTTNGKGSLPRPIANRELYATNYDEIFGNHCSEHPSYDPATATEPPLHDCMTCRRLWRERICERFERE
jgi:hypothetical protein